MTKMSHFSKGNMTKAEDKKKAIKNERIKPMSGYNVYE